MSVNEAAGDICVHNPAMLTERGELLTLARQAVHDSGYQYKKKRSRSKSFGSGEAPQKRAKVSASQRSERVR